MAKRVLDTTPEPTLTAANTFLPCNMMEEMSLFYDFLVKGIDAEDIFFTLKKATKHLSLVKTRYRLYLFLEIIFIILLLNTICSFRLKDILPLTMYIG